jgi:hypothetical protein
VAPPAFSLQPDLTPRPVCGAACVYVTCSNTYSALNALAGHYNSFGATAPIPKKRLDRLTKVCLCVCELGRCCMLRVLHHACDPDTRHSLRARSGHSHIGADAPCAQELEDATLLLSRNR